MTIEQVLKKVKENDPKADLDMIRLAYDFADHAHQNQFRRSGEPYIQHSLHAAYTLAQMKADMHTIMAGLLHDVPEDTTYTLEDVEKNFGKDVRSLVEGITKLSKVKYRGIERYAESLKKMFLAMANDPRVIIIKFADRLHNLVTLDALPPEKRERIAKETMEIYAPIAGLLGVARLKWQMEDICFKYLYPEEYKKLEYKYEVEKKLERHQYIEVAKNILKKKLKEEKIEAEITGRFKHLYSIFQKLHSKEKDFDDIYDVFALRVIVDNITDCYKTIGVIHALWKPKVGRFKDYIAVPKPNGYRSLHTVVFGPNGKATEFQVRTKEMHEEALYGIAAHWHYKKKNNQSGNNHVNNQPAWIQEIMELQRQAKDTNEFVNKVKLDVFHDRIFLFTPKGDVYDLPEGSTPVDFAYAVHTDVGNKCVGAMVNDKIAPLETKLKNGDLVQIITEKNRKAPSRDWLKFAKTSRARDKIKQSSRMSAFASIKRFIPGTKK